MGATGTPGHAVLADPHRHHRHRRGAGHPVHHPELPAQGVLDGLARLPAKQTVVLGLDLQGGSHLLLQVNRESIVTERIKTLRRDVRPRLCQRERHRQPDHHRPGFDHGRADRSDAEGAAIRRCRRCRTMSRSTFGVGGVPELAFSETTDGKIVVS
jgi:SecD/SecF fusion protein